MNIAVVGGGITGLTAAYELTKNGHTVTVFEKESYLGGLAFGFNPPAGGWEWSLEASYHHLFTNDRAIVSLIQELGIGAALLKIRPVTANYWHGNMYQFDSPMHLLRFPGLPLLDKLRTGALAAFCKVYPFWQTLEGVTAKRFFTAVGGAAGWKIIWEPLMTGKFGHYDSTIAASWLWARINKRTPSLYYIEGGFKTFIDALTDAIKNTGGNILTDSAVSSIRKASGNSYLVYWRKQQQLFDTILFTTPTPAATRILSQIPNTKYQPPPPIPHLWAQTLILETDKPVLKDVYWLNITDRSFPFLAVVAHTNFVDKKHYGNHHITYIGNYLPDNHPYLSMTKAQLINKFIPFIKRINPNCELSTVNCQLFTSPYAQPVHQIHYSKKAPRIDTGINAIYLANMDSVYPWDRGTNYAVELGKNAAKRITA